MLKTGKNNFGYGWKIKNVTKLEISGTYFHKVEKFRYNFTPHLFYKKKYF